MLAIVFILFIGCYFFCLRRVALPLCACIFLLTFILLHEIFGAFFFTINPILNINYWLFLFGFLYFSLLFSTFFWLGRYGLPGVLLHSLIMVIPSLLKVMLPLHPFILLYPRSEFLLPSTHYPLLNLFCLFFISGLIFCKSSHLLKVGVLLLLLCIFSLKNNYADDNSHKSDIKIAVVQVGLYFEKGGNTTDFLNDLLVFLDNNPKVSSIVFSENNVFSFKNPYNKNLSEKLLNDIKNLNLQHKFHFFLSFNGYKNLNNIVTLYLFGDNILLNQKKTLIPFIEKSGFFNKKNDITSEYYYIYESHKNSLFNVMGTSVSTYICYDALFPEMKANQGDIVLIQSNYKLLDKGYGYDKLKYFATYLAKFLNGMHSQVVINVQNYGGTVVLYDDWSIDHHIYEISKNEPFFILDTGKLE
ncbi:hypothetical protein ACLMPP_20685 [Yersinia enterocolitica]|uniref:hypothetical protein n=1 Tax=Yersinia enterocolitica TaxID=630 RepID=UPI00398D127D